MLIKNELQLPDFLRRHGFTPWLSRDDIQPGENWNKSIPRHLELSDWFILIMSPQSATSEGVEAELNWALTNRKNRIIPLRVGDCQPEEFSLSLSLIQYLDIYDRGWNTATKMKLLDRLGVDTSSLSAIDDESSNPRRIDFLKLTDEQKKKLRQEIETKLTEDKLKSIFTEDEEIFGRSFYNQIPGNDYRTRIVNVIRELNNRQLINDFITVVRDDYPNFGQDL